MQWSYGGDLLCTTAKDSMMRLIDVRSSAVTGQVKSHNGSRHSRVVWLGNSSYVATCGHSAVNTSDLRRTVCVWDTRMMSTNDAGE